MSHWIVATLVLTTFNIPAAAQDSVTDEEQRFRVFASGLFNVQTFSVLDSRRTPLYHEESQFNGSWKSATGPAFGFGATYEIFRSLSVGASVEFLSATSDESFRASIPHPLFFDSERRLDGEAPALSYDEKALHFLIGYSRNMGKIMLSAYGGPSYFWTSTEMIDDLTYSETYPFDEVELDTVQSKTFDANQFGFNVGGWLGYRVLKQLAIGGDFRYSWAAPKFTNSAGNEIEMTAGGIRLGVGVRFLF